MDRLQNTENTSVSSGFTSLSFDYSQQDNFDSVSWSKLLNRLDTDDLLMLRSYFYPNEKERRDTDTDHLKFDQNISYCGIPLNKEEFATIINNIIGSNVYASAANNLFDHLSNSNKETESNVIWWTQILDTMIENWDKNQITTKHFLEDSISIHPATHSKRESIIKVIPVEREKSFCYIIVSKFGNIGIYDGKLNLLDSYKIALAKEKNDEVQRVSNSCWVTDAIYLEDAVTLLVAGSNRSLHLFDVSGLNHIPVVTISGMPNTPNCLHYSKGSLSLLFIGDDQGNITTLKFSKPKHSLFSKTSVNENDLYFWTELYEQSEWVAITVKTGIHKDAIQQISYCCDNSTIVSCSQSGQTALVIQHLNVQRIPYIFRLPKGVKCFQLNYKWKLLVTGGSDNILRIWNPVVPKTPIASLYGHKSVIIDVEFLLQSKTVISFSADGVLKHWDIENQRCIQTIELKFPAFNIPGKFVEFGKKSIYPGPLYKEPPTLRQPKSGWTAAAESSTCNNDFFLTSTNQKNTETETSIIKRNETRSNSILIVCHNNISVIKVSDYVEETSLMSPPDINQMPKIPMPWIKMENTTNNLLDSPSVSLCSMEVPDRKTGKITLLGENSMEVLHQVKNHLRHSLGLNQCKIKQFSSDKRIRSLVEQCTPHLALQLSDLEQSQVQLQTSKNFSARLLAWFKSSELHGPEKGARTKLTSDQSMTPSRLSSCSLSSHHASSPIKFFQENQSNQLTVGNWQTIYSNRKKNGGIQILENGRVPSALAQQL